MRIPARTRDGRHGHLVHLTDDGESVIEIAIHGREIYPVGELIELQHPDGRWLASTDLEIIEASWK